MNRPMQFLIFFSVAILVTLGLHYYVWVRLVRDPALGGAWRTGATVLVWGLFAAMVLSLPLSRLVPRAVARPVLWVVYIWMGTLILLFFTLLGAEVVRLVLLLIERARDPGGPDLERRQWLARMLAAGVASVTAGLAAYAVGQARRPVAVREVPITLPRLPAALHGLRVVQLSDIHIGATLDREWLADVVARVNALQPDLIAITGDLVDGSVAELGPHVAPIGELRARHGTFFVTGNHEYYSGADAWIAELRRLGVRVLRNERVALQHGPSPEHALDLAGVDDYHSHGWPGHGPDLPRALSGRDGSRPVLLLAHQPIAALEAAELGVDLQLSGHTHGGQIWPWGYLVRLQQPYVSGLHRLPGGHTQLYVSNGTGYWGPPMRLLAPAEITLLTLHSPAAA